MYMFFFRIENIEATSVPNQMTGIQWISWIRGRKGRGVLLLKIAKVDVRSNCVCLKLRYSIHAYCILGFLFYGKRTTSKIIVIEKALNIIFNNYYLRAEDTSDLFVASGEGPKFFQNLHLSINVFLRIYELEICPKRQPNLFSTKVVNSVDDSVSKVCILSKFLKISLFSEA
ncbi:hypothetical protein Avbf_18698 [Armadillidium vulgare]|nr:hypothetical protein Avbf_18698 [Armadillidium vulgare]